MKANNTHVDKITASLNERVDIYESIQLPVVDAIRTAAESFSGKVFNRRFTAAVTKALESNPNRIKVGFATNWDNSTDYEIFAVHYNYNGKCGEFRIYPDRTTVKNHTDEAGRLDPAKLLATCDKEKAAILVNIESDKAAINKAADFVARVEAVRSEIEAINKEFPLALRARISGNLEFRR